VLFPEGVDNMVTYRDRAWGIAVHQHGYITTQDAAAAGIPGIELAKIASRGRLAHVARGLYRFNELPPTKFSQYYEAVLRLGGDAHLVGDAVLALHDLALVNPRSIRVGTSKRIRSALPDWISPQASSERREDFQLFQLIPCSSVARAIREARPYVIKERLIDSLPKAVYEGLLDEREAQRLEIELKENLYECTQ
jgi:hypothetical protein